MEPFDLIPQRERSRRERRRLVYFLASTAIVVLFTLLVGWLFVQVQRSRTREKIAGLSRPLPSPAMVRPAAGKPLKEEDPHRDLRAHLARMNADLDRERRRREAAGRSRDRLRRDLEERLAARRRLSGPIGSTVLVDLARRAHGRVRLSSLRLGKGRDGSHGLRIEGEAERHEGFVAFLSRLGKMAGVHSLQVVSMTRSKDRARFTLDGAYWP